MEPMIYIVETDGSVSEVSRDLGHARAVARRLAISGVQEVSIVHLRLKAAQEYLKGKGIEC